MLEAASSKFRHELYQSCTPDSDKEWSFAGLINHIVAFPKTEDVTAGTDVALETLKNNLATFTQAKEARGYIHFTLDCCDTIAYHCREQDYHQRRARSVHCETLRSEVAEA